MNTSSRHGLSLLVVLTTMLLATLVGTALYKVLTYEGNRSGAQMHQASAEAAAKAGLEASKTWFAFNAIEVKGLLESFSEARLANPDVVFGLDVGAPVLPNGQKQFRVILIDVYNNTSSSEVSVKLQVVGYGKQGAEAVLTSVLKLGGMVSVTSNFNTPMSSQVYIGDDDAIFVGGSGTDIKTSLIARGSLYLTLNAAIQSPVTVENDLVIAGSNSVQKVTQPMKVGGNALFKGRMEVQSDISIGGSARFLSLKHLNGAINIGDSAGGGDFYVDTLSTENGNTLNVKRQSGNKGNTFIGAQFTGMNGVVNSGGDLRVGPSVSSFTYSNGGQLNTNGNVWLQSPVNPDGTRFNFNGDYGFYVTGAEVPTHTGSGTPVIAEGPFYNNFNPDTVVTLADDLDVLNGRLNTTTQTKDQPYILKEDTLNRYAGRWSKWRDLAQSYCTYNSTIGLQAEEWNCIHDYMSLTYPEYMKNGYLYVDMNGIDNNIDVVGTGILDRNFVFYYPNPASPLRLFGNTPNSQVIWWLPNGASQTHIVTPAPFDRIYGIVYTTGNLDVGSANLRVNGQILTGPNANVNGNGGVVDATFDPSVLAALASQTGLMEGPAINLGESVSGTHLSVTDFHPLAPTLQVNTLAEDMESTLLDTSNIQDLPGGVVFMPSFAVVNVNDPRTVQQIMSDLKVKVFYTQGLDSNCTYNPTDAPAPPWLNDAKVSFESCKGRKTIFTVHVLPESSVPTGSGNVQFARATDTFEEAVGTDATYNVSLLRTINQLNGAGNLVFDVSGSTAIVGTDFDLGVTSLAIPDKTTENTPFNLPVIVYFDNVPDEPDRIIRITVRSVGNTNLTTSPPSTILINLTDLNFTTQKLTWTETDEDLRHGQFNIKPSMGTVTQNAPTEWSVRKNAKVLIQAQADPFYVLDSTSWSGICAGTTGSTCTISQMDTDKEFGVQFVKKQFTLKLSPQATAKGNITYSPTANSSTADGSDQILTFDAGTSVELTANAQTGYSFMGWTGHLSGRRSNPISVLMDSNMVVGAAYASAGSNCLYTSFNDWTDGSGTNVWHPSIGTWSLSSSWVRGSASASSAPALLLYDKPIQLNGKVEAKIDVGSDSQAWQNGLLLRYVDSDNYITVGYRNATFQQNHILFCHKTTALGQEVCTEHANHLDTASSVDLAVEALENTFIIYVNSKMAAVVQAAGHETAGKVGLITRSTAVTRMASTYRWVDGLGCSSNNAPELADCRLETLAEQTADPLVINQGETFRVRATVSDADGLKNDGVRYIVTTNDGFAMEEVANVEYFNGGLKSKDLKYCYHGACYPWGSLPEFVTTGPHQGLGDFFATLVVKDQSGAEAFCEMPFRVVENVNNTNPVLEGILVNGVAYNNETIDLATIPTIEISVKATDADNDTLSFAWSGALGEKTEKNKTSGYTSVFSVTPSSGGSFLVQVTVADGQGGVVTQQVQLFLKSGTNSAPIITDCSASPASGEVPLLVRFVGRAYDPDQDQLTYVWSGGDGFSFAGEFPPAYTFRAAANHDVKLTVTDSKGASATCNLTVSTTTTVNQPPTQVSCSADQTTGTGGLMAVRLTGSATDPEGGAINFRWVFNNGDQVWGNPYQKAIGDGVYTIHGVAVDDKGAETPCAPITINNKNTPPTVSFTVDKSSGYSPLSVVFTPTFADKDGDDVTLSWNVDAGSGCSVVENKCVFDAAGSWVVTLTATDSKGGTATAQKTIFVSTNSAPIASCSGSPNPAGKDSEVIWTVTASDPENDLPLTIEWSGDDGLTGAVQNVKHIYTAAGEKSATVKVKDPAGAVGSATCSVQIETD